ISLWTYHHAVSTLWWQLIIITLAAIFLSGIYPAFFLAGYDPVKVLKENFSRGKSGIALRNLLIIVQFLIAAIFITGILVIRKQVNYMAHADLGFQPSGLINLRVSYDRKLYIRIKSIPGVEYVGTTSQLMGNSPGFMKEIKYKDENVNFNIATVTMEAFNAMRVKLLEGRLFSPQYGQDTINSVILNKSAAKLLGEKVIGENIYENDSLQKHIVGVIADYHYEGFDKKILPTVYALLKSHGPSLTTTNLLIKTSPGQYKKVMASVHKIWNSLYPGYPMQYILVNDSFRQVMGDDIRFQKIVSTFTLLSLILSLMGIFALSAFMTARRVKEISIRRILGASLTDILRLLNTNFVVLVILANVLAWPVAYLLVKQWLNGFVYRIDVPIMAFITAIILSIILTILTVSLQALKAVKANPADALKYE
ncbi:MAG TPA: FtsX-like permease family protein, partial [Chitinophagaceae bacterium]|nr:FtsX-like permease family protein [Chitinophagaceae bacterium]